MNNYIVIILEYGKASYMWNSWNTNKQNSLNCIPFVLKFRLPKLRESRLIFDRVELGRVITSKIPEIR